MAIAETPSRTTAPPGIGLRIDPVIVPRKIASNRHDWGVIPAGTGTISTTKTTANTIAQRMSF
jgi:hypothetical protein